MVSIAPSSLRDSVLPTVSKTPPARGGEGIVKKLIGVVDLATGAIANRSAETLTLDIPADLDRETGSVSVDADRIVRYFAAGGARRLYVGRPSRLSARVLGEEFLVANEAIASEGSTCLRQYSLAIVDALD
jgi:hypothetical protein